MIDWSVTNLPLPSALSVTNRSATLRKKAESGRYLQRRRFTTAYEEGTVSFKFLKEQFQIFKGVWVHYLNNGTTAFTIDLPVGGNTTLTNCEVKFVSDYSYQYVSVDYVTVQCKIEFKEVTAPDKLALDNLINVSDIYLQREAETVVVTFTNIDGTSTNYVRCTLNGEVTNSIPQATQFWDGTVHLHTGTPSTFKYLETTISEEEFVLHHYPTYDTISPDPNPNGKFGKFAVANGQTNLKRWDPNSTPSYYWKGITLTNTVNYIPPVNDIDFEYVIKDNGEYLSFTNVEKVQNIRLQCEDNANLGWDDTIDDIYLNNNDNLRTFEVSLAPNNIQAAYSKMDIRANNALESISIRGLRTQSPTSGVYAETHITYNPNLTYVNLGGNTNYIREWVLLNDNDLNDIDTDSGKYLWVTGGNQFILQNNNIGLTDLPSIISKLKGDPTVRPSSNIVRISGNPCWFGNEFSPAGFGSDQAITSISSTATEFTVTTSTSHGLTAGDDIKIIGSTPSDYNGIWEVATIPTTTTFTVANTGNFASSSSATLQKVVNQTTADFEINAWYNGFVFAS